MLACYVCSVPRLRPPTCTPFPYTTLFRSSQVTCDPLPAGEVLRGFLVRFCCGLSSCSPPDRPQQKRTRKPDRKSTRLNSSHRCISYAVFCVKKKKNKKNCEDARRRTVNAA